MEGPRLARQTPIRTTANLSLFFQKTTTGPILSYFGSWSTNRDYYFEHTVVRIERSLIFYMLSVLIQNFFWIVFFPLSKAAKYLFALNSSNEPKGIQEAKGYRKKLRQMSKTASAIMAVCSAKWLSGRSSSEQDHFSRQAENFRRMISLRSME